MTQENGFTDDDPSNVRQIGERRGDPVESRISHPSNQLPNPVEPSEPVDWDDTPYATDELPANTPPDFSLPSKSDPRNGNTRRQQIIDEAAHLADTALQAWTQALDVMGIVDLDAREKYSRLTKGIASAVEEWEEKL